MLVFGGNTTKASFDDLWEFAVASATWRQVRAAGGSPPSGRVGHTLCAMGSRLLVLGGRECAAAALDPTAGRRPGAALTPATPATLEATPPPGTPTLGWHARTASKPPPRLTRRHGWHAASSARRYSTNLFDSRLHAFHFQTRRWSEVVLSARRGDAREASGGTVLVRSALRTGHCATLHAGKLLLFGGLNDRNEMLDDLTSVDLIS